MKSDNKIGNLSRSADVLTACGALIPLARITFLGATMHYCLGDSFVWQEEVQLALIIWVVFPEGRHVSVYGNHTVIDVIVEMFSEKLRKLPGVLVAAAAVIILCCMGYQGARYIVQVIRHDRATSILKAPYSLIYTPLPIGCLTMAVQVCLNTCKGLAGKGEGV